MPKLPLVLRLLLAGVAVATAAAPEVAYAQPAAVFDAAGLLEMVPPTSIVGDGATAADLYVLALDANGAPVGGLALKPSVSAGSVSALTDAGGGLYRITFTPSKVETKTTVSLTLKGKVGKDTVQKSWNFVVNPPRSQQLAAAANPPRMILGQDRTATISFNLAGGDRQALSGVDLAITASSGTVENLTNLGGGQFTALYTAPAVNYPHVAMLTIADKRDPSRTFGSLAIPLWGKVEFPVTTTPNARVMVKLADQQFGPIQANATGYASVPILVPPGAQVADKVSIGADGKSVTEPLNLQVPEAKRIAMVPMAAALPGDARVQVPVHALVVTPDGKPDTNASVVFTTTGGTIGQAKNDGNGIYTALYSPATSSSAIQATITASLADRPQVQTVSQTVNMVSVRPAKVELVAEPATLPASADGFKVYAKVTGPDGVGLGNRTVSFGSGGARLKGEVKDLRNGDYQATFSTTGAGPVELTATVAAPVTGNPATRLLLVPSRSRLANDGSASSLITVVSVDEFGYPVPNVAVTLKLTGGDGVLPAQATTNSEGIAQVYYTAGRKAGLVTFEAAAGDLAAAGALAQVPAGLAIATIPVAGNRTDAGLVAEWDKALADLRVEREGAAGGMAGPMVVSEGPARPTRAALVSDPATVSAGGTVKLKVPLSDESGRGVAGQQLDFLASSGTIGTVTDLGGGLYEAPYTLPANASGEVKVSVATRDGTASSFMRVPVGGAAGAWTSGNPYQTQATVDPYAAKPATPTPPPPPVAVAPPPPPVAVAPPPPVAKPPPPPPGDHPWLRVRAGFELANYDYDQRPLSKATVLFPRELKLSSLSYGGHANVRAFVPGMKYLGGEIDFRDTVYSLNPVPLCAALDNECKDAGLVSDQVLAARANLIGRYAFESGSTQFGVGGHLGWAISDVQTFTVKGGQEIQLDQLSLNSLVVGAELSADVGRGFFATAQFNEHLAGFTTPFQSEVGVEVGYAFLPNVYASLSWDLGLRSIAITNLDGKQVGEISDTFNGGALSIGAQF